MSAPRLFEQVRQRVRTEEGYLHRTRRFSFFHGKKHPRRMDGPQVEAFLSHPAAKRRRSTSDPAVAGESLGITDFQ